MDQIRDLRTFRLPWRRCCGFLAIYCLSVPVALAQSSVAVKVENTHGAAVPDVKVMARRVEAGSTDSPGGQVLNLLKSEDGRYSIDGLAKGKYKFYACNADLNYEPDYKEVSLGGNESKKFTLVLQEELTTQPVADMKAGEKVCLVHDETGCSAIKVVDENGAVSYAGVRDHYHVEDAEACKKD